MSSRVAALVLTTLALIVAPWAKGMQADRPAVPEYRDSTSLPEGLPGARIQALIDTVNSGSAERIRAFLDRVCTERFRTAFPLEDHVGEFSRFRWGTGGVDFYGIRSYTPERPGQTVVIVKARDVEGYWGVAVRFGTAPDLLLDSIGFSPARPPLDPNA